MAQMNRKMRNSCRKWAGNYFDGWLRKWAIESAFKAGWLMALGHKLHHVDNGQEPRIKV